MNLRAFFPVLVLFATASLVRADMLGDTSQETQDQLEKGQTVLLSKPTPDGPWPKLTVYQVVNASPKVVYNLLTDLNSAPSYTPNLLGAKVLTTNPDGSKDVEYTVKMPVLGKISYTVRNTYLQKGNRSEVSWTLLKSPLAKKSDGSLTVEPYGNGQSLLRYNNLVVPITNLVAGLKNQAANEAKTTVQSIAREAERRAGN